jgi:tellurite methyltransferase
MDSKSKWNLKYEERLIQNEEPTPNKRFALDLACGLGGNSLFLAQLNYKVIIFWSQTFFE